MRLVAAALLLGVTLTGCTSLLDATIVGIVLDHHKKKARRDASPATPPASVQIEHGASP